MLQTCLYKPSDGGEVRPTDTRKVSHFMMTKDIIPDTQDDPDEHVWTIDELLEYFQHIKSTYGNLPVVGRGYEMGMDNLHPEVLHIFRGAEGVCGTFADSNWKDETKTGTLAVALGNAG